MSGDNEIFYKERENLLGLFIIRWCWENLKLSTVCDGDGLRGLARLRAITFDLLHNVHALNDGAKDNVTIVQPASLDRCNEEL